MSSKVLGHTASLHNPALHKILELAGEVGLVVILHCDINTVRPVKAGRPAHFDALKDIFRAHPRTTIIWAPLRSGPFRGSHAQPPGVAGGTLPRPRFLPRLLRPLLGRGRQVGGREFPGRSGPGPAVLNAYPERFLFGSDSVAPAGRDAYLKTYRDYQPLWEQLDESASRKTRYGNYERLFDAANHKVRDWEGQ